MKSISFTDAKIRVQFEHDERGCWLTLQELQSGRQWPRVPALAFEVYDRATQRVERLPHLHVDSAHEVTGGVHVMVTDRMRGLKVGLWFRIIEGQLSVSMPPAELYELNPILYRLFAVDVLPGMLHCDARGEMLLPINTGMICRPINKPALEDRFLIYGEQSRWELLPTLPVCAIQTPTGGLIAMAVSAAAETECRVSTNGEGSGNVGLSFFVRGNDTDPVEPAIREIRYIPIPPGKDLTVFTAVQLRQHIVRDLGKPTLAQRAKESPEVAYLLNAYIMKLFYGVQMQGQLLGEHEQPSEPKFHLSMTFDEAGNGLKSLKEAGIDKIYTQNVGWNYRGHDGAYPTRFPIEERVGGEKSFRKLIELGHQLGYQMTVHDNYMDAYEASADFNLDLITVDRLGQPQLRGFWGGGPSYLTWPGAFEHQHLEGQMQQVKDLGIRGPYYLDGMGSPLYINYHPKHRGTRSDHARGIDRLLQAARKLFGSAATESGFLYCSITPDLVANPGGHGLIKLFKPEWGVTRMVDSQVPLWHLVMSGLVVTENQGMDWPQTMRCLLYNQHPRFEWSTRPGIMPVLDRSLTNKMKARYDLLLKRFGHLQVDL